MIMGMLARVADVGFIDRLSRLATGAWRNRFSFLLFLVMEEEKCFSPFFLAEYDRIAFRALESD